jgi:hypothetical protein
MMSPGLAKKINILCLLAAIVVVLVLPLHKEIWYDETVSMLCSKGISHDSPALMGNATTVSSTALEQMNTLKNVYKATVLDNGNSIIYNVKLHYFTLLFGNSISMYMLFSKLCAIVTLLAFFALCRLVVKDGIFTSVAILLLAADLNFIGMSHEIRAYELGMCFCTLAAVFFYKFMYDEEKPFYLFLLGLFSVGAVLSHFLSLYVIVVFLGYMVASKKAKLLSGKNIPAMLVPVALVAVYLACAYMGLKYMSHENEKFQAKAAALPFSAVHVLFRSMAMGALDFKAVFPAFGEKKLAVIFSVLLLAALYIGALKSAENKEEKRNLNLFLILGASGTLFLALLCFKSGHYTALYNRYHSFCIPFACLFTAYTFYLMAKSAKVQMTLKAAAMAVIVLPACGLFVIAASKVKDNVEYNHIAIAKEIVRDKVSKIEIPTWDDAFLIQSVLPRGYKIDYVLNAASPYFTLYKAGGPEKVPLIRKNS